jgi:TM2 domain-containing membrane protein YozV
METSNISPKSRVVALFFCLLLGVIGVHRFYLGKIGTGILMALTLGGLGIWALIDLILIAAGSFRDKEGRRVFRWTEPDPV